jgi:hypothetical protein
MITDLILLLLIVVILDRKVKITIERVTATRECPLSAQLECPLLARGIDERWGTLDECQGA